MSAIYLKSLSSPEVNEFLDSFDTVLTDCDGNCFFLSKNLILLYILKISNSFLLIMNLY